MNAVPNDDRSHDPLVAPFGGTGSPRTRRATAVVLAVLVIAAAAVSYLATRDRTSANSAGSRAPAEAAEGGPMPVTLGPREQARIGVTFAAVMRAPLDQSVRTVAQVSYDETRVRTVSPLIDGWVDRLFVNFTGQAVRPGDPLFSIYSPMVVTAQQDLILAKRLAAQLKEGTPEGAQGAQDLLQSARRRLEYWGVMPADVQQIEATGRVRRTVTLRSPYAGVVVEKPILAGQRIMAGDIAYKIADLSRVWLEGEVFERDLPAVRLGQVVTAEFTALPGVARRGRVKYVYPIVDPDTRTGRIRVELENPGLRLKPGMYATIRFAARTDSVLSVPRAAVLATGERNLVFVRTPGGKFAPHLVTLGATTDERVEIIRGLTARDTVVASGTFLVDAESNLGALMGGMGNMPGMDLTAPAGKTRPPGAGRDSQPAHRKE